MARCAAGFVLVIAAAFLLVGIDVRDASACSLAIYPVQRELFPADNTLEVPRNARFTVRYQHLLPNEALAETATLVVRDGSGVRLDLQIEQESGSTRLVVATPTEPLKANTEYEILLLPISCELEYQEGCFGSEPETVATIKTGTAFDDVPPVFLEGMAEQGGVYGSSCFDPNCTCDFDYKVVYKGFAWPGAVDGVDSGPVRVRYKLYIDGVLASGNNLVDQPSGTTGILCTGLAGEAGFNPSIERSTGTYSVRAVDLAGNEIQHPESITLQPYDCSSNGETTGDGGTNGGGETSGGCGCTAGRSATSTAAGYGLVLFFLALSGRHRTRRRAS